MSSNFYNKMREMVGDPNRKAAPTTPEQWAKLYNAIQDPAMREKLKIFVPRIEAHAKELGIFAAP